MEHQQDDGQAQTYALLSEKDRFYDDHSEDSDITIQARDMRSRKKSWRKFWMPTLVTFLAVSAVGLATIQLFEIRPRYGRSPRRMIPDFPLRETRFEPSELYGQRSTPESDAAWDALAGPLGTKSQQGFIFVDDSSPYGIMPGYPKDGGEIFGIAMYHQLHCLASIRKHVWALLDGTFDKEAFFAVDGDVNDPGFVPGGHGAWHLKHCFNLIRQGIQCAGDWAIEYPTYFNDTPLVVGWNSLHMCRDWDSMWLFLQEH